MPATIKDIRAYTGLSLATISKYLNGGNVLPENRIKIEQAIEVLHYEVNEIARGLVTNKTNTIGIVVYDISSVFAGEILSHMGSVLREKGYGTLICDSSCSEELEKKNVDFLISKKVDGILIIPISRSGETLQKAKSKGTPVVCLDRMVDDETFDGVSIDNKTATRKIMESLLEHHHRKIGLIGSQVEYTANMRVQAFLEAMADAGIEVPEEYIHLGRLSMEYGFDSIIELMKLPDPPTAVFTCNYEVSLGAVMGLNHMGISFPEQVSLFGFDNQLLMNVVRPTMNLAVQPIREMSETAVALLLDRIENKQRFDSEGDEVIGRRVVLQAEIQDGASVRYI